MSRLRDAVLWSVRQVRRFFQWSAKQGPILVAFELLALSAFINAVAGFNDERNEHANDAALREQLARTTFEQECRFDLSQPVSEIQAEKLDALALGLVAVTEEDAAGLAFQTERIRDLSRREQDALAARAAAVETCSERARERFE